MNYNQLIKDLHQLNKQEIFLKDHQLIRENSELIQQFNSSLTEEEKNVMLVPLVDKESVVQTFPASYFFNPDTALKVKILRHNRYTTPIIHKHDFYEIMYVFEGEFLQKIGNQAYQMKTGDATLIPPGIYHSCDVNNSSIVLNIIIEKHTFQEIFLNNLPGNQVFAHFFKNDFYTREVSSFITFQTMGDADVRDTILKMYLEIINQEDYYAPVVHSLLLFLLSILLRRYEKTAITPSGSKRADNIDLEIIDYINKNYPIVSLDNLSHKFHYSGQYISQRIRSVTGLSFNRYLTSRRMEVAADFLRYTNNSITEISEKIGYQNPETFIRTFKQHYKTTPGRYRHNEKGFK